MNVTSGAGLSLRAAARGQLGDFLIAEYGHVTESLLRNEESGEKRAAFFITLAGAAGAVLAFAFGEHGIFDRSRLPFALAVTAGVLLAFGLMTTRRLIERHVETDRYKFALRELRRIFVARDQANAAPNSFFQPYERPQVRPLSARSAGKGGWLETVSAVNALLAGVLLAIPARTPGHVTPLMLAAFVAGAVIAWTLQLERARRRIDGALQKLREADSIQRRRDEEGM